MFYWGSCQGFQPDIFTGVFHEIGGTKGGLQSTIEEIEVFGMVFCYYGTYVVFGINSFSQPYSFLDFCIFCQPELRRLAAVLVVS